MVQVETLVERSDVGVLTPFFGMLPVSEHFNKKKSSVTGTVLSPRGKNPFTLFFFNFLVLSLHFILL